MSKLSRVDLASVAGCCVREVRRLLGIGQPVDTAECSDDHGLVVSADGRWRTTSIHG